MCPICGANCRCKNAGPSGLCCSCHRHKPKSQAYYGSSLEKYNALHREEWEKQKDQQRATMRDA